MLSKRATCLVQREAFRALVDGQAHGEPEEHLEHEEELRGRRERRGDRPRLPLLGEAPAAAVDVLEEDLPLHSWSVLEGPEQRGRGRRGQRAQRLHDGVGHGLHVCVCQPVGRRQASGGAAWRHSLHSAVHSCKRFLAMRDYIPCPRGAHTLDQQDHKEIKDKKVLLVVLEDKVLKEQLVHKVQQDLKVI